MKYVLIAIGNIFFSINVFSHSIYVKSIVENKKLVPCIYINNQRVMRVLDKGVNSEFDSSFERAQHIAETLIELKTKKYDISRIRIRYKDKIFYGYIKRRKLFAVSKKEVLLHQSKSAFELAKKWRRQIKEALIFNELEKS